MRYLFFLSIIISLLSCHPEKMESTVFKGNIVDINTRIPIKDAIITGDFVDENYHSTGEFINVKTGEDGYFEIDRKGRRITNLFIWKIGYYTKDGALGQNLYDANSNTHTILMVPRDAQLKVLIQNTSGLQDSLFFEVYSSVNDAENGFSNGRVISFDDRILHLAAGQTDTVDISVTADEKVKIYWGLIPPKPYYQLKTIEFVDSVSVAQHDTLIYPIHF